GPVEDPVAALDVDGNWSDILLENHARREAEVCAEAAMHDECASRADGRVAGEVKLRARREDTHPGAASGGFVWKDEGSLGEIELASDRLHLGGGQAPRVRQDGQRIAGERRRGEDVDNVEEPAHRSPLSGLG